MKHKHMSPLIEVEVLGCGTSTGVPVINCTCPTCRSRNPKNKRLRASIWVKTQGKSFIVDTSTDFRQQALRSKIKRVDALLFTHPHTDHISGLDEIRCYNFTQQEAIEAYGNEWTTSELRMKFAYVFNGTKNEGGGIPLIDLHTISVEANRSLTVQGVPITLLEATHGSKNVLGYRFGSFAYLTDCKIISESTLSHMENLDTLILDGLREKPHNTHSTIAEALATIARLRPRRAFLTHLAHDLEYGAWKKKLPRGVALAHDGLKLKIE